MSAVREFFQACAQAALEGMPSPHVPDHHHDLIAEGASVFAHTITAAPKLEFEPASLPLLDSLIEPSTVVGQLFVELAHELVWQPGKGDGSTRAIVEIGDMFDLGDIRAGLLYCTPNDGYPEHNHPPQEMYIMLDGTAAWRFGGRDDYVEMAPGETLYNHPLDTHGVRTTDQASLSLWVLWGDNTHFLKDKK